MMPSRRKFLLFLSSWGLTPSISFAQKRENYVKRREVQAWIRETAAMTGMPASDIQAVLAKARFSPLSARLMQSPQRTSTAKPGNWYAHRKNFLASATIRAGRQFASRRKALLKELERDSGVPGEILCAVIGVETRFGQLMGNVRTLDALVTLSFDYTRRAQYFQSELASFLTWCDKENINPLTVKGSFAGAVGLCQFMPSNILKYGVDHDKDGSVRLRSSAEDALASVANYLMQEGWNASLPITWPCRVESAAAKQLYTGGIVTNKSIRVAGDEFNEDIREYMGRQYNIKLGERTAELIKINVGSALNELENPPEDYIVHGPNRMTSLPMELPVTYQDVAHCIEKSVSKIEAAVLSALDSTPPELYADIVRNGIYLTGGGALLRGLDKRLTDKIGIAFHVAEDPLLAVARGTGIALKNVDKFSFLMR